MKWLWLGLMLIVLMVLMMMMIMIMIAARLSVYISIAYSYPVMIVMILCLHGIWCAYLLLCLLRTDKLGKHKQQRQKQRGERIRVDRSGAGVGGLACPIMVTDN